MSQLSDPKVIVALDYQSADDALALAQRLDPALCRVKVGKELFTYAGPKVVQQLQSLGFDVFLDLKFHDIPNTTAQAVTAAANLGVWMVNVHASGGAKMMLAAQEAIDKSTHKPLLIAVTVLTSMESSDLQQLGITRSPLEQVVHLAKLAQESGLGGVVCSAQEAKALKAECGQGFQLITPGIRPADASLGDQKRVMTPVQALQEGSDYLVIGRPITQAIDPAAALEKIAAEIAAMA